MLLLALATPAAGSAQEAVRAETEDWVLTAPWALVSQADLDLVDALRSVDGIIDIVGCGSGTDTVVADRGDLVGVDCERIRRR